MNKIMLYGLDAYNYIRLGKSSFLEMNKMKKTQYYSKDELNKMINEKIKNIVNFAYENVPMYRKLYMKSDLNKIRSPEQLHQLPITTKDTFRSALPDNALAKVNKSRAIYDVTSGSTGEPFEFFKDRNSGPITQASYKLFNTWMGIESNARFVHFKSPEELNNIQKFRDWVYGRTRISVFDISPSTIKNLIDRMNEIDPIFIEGYTASIVNLASLILENDLKIDFKPRAIVATSEDLIKPHRKMLEDVFRCKVFNRYGSKEFSGALAQECDSFEGLHVNSTLCYLEIVDEDNEPVGVGEEGKILITDFNNYVMPFIRYDIGDMAIKGPELSECGRVFPIVKNILGRKGGFFISKNNVKIPFLPIANKIFGDPRYGPYVYNFQFVQKNKSAAILKIVPKKEISDVIINEIYDFLYLYLIDFSISIEIVDFIEPENTGKRPFFKPMVS